MDEKEVNQQYKSLQKSDSYKKQVENLEQIKSSLTPQKYAELKALLVGSLETEGSLHTAALRVFDKKVESIRRAESKESKAADQALKDISTARKISQRPSIASMHLKKRPRFTQRRLRTNSIGSQLSPVSELEEEEESSSSKRKGVSKGGKRNKRSAPKSSRQKTKKLNLKLGGTTDSFGTPP